MTDAMLYTIEDRSREYELRYAELSHFTLIDAQNVSSQRIVDEPTWTPFCIDAQRRHMAFVDVPLKVDFTQSAFVHRDQFLHARRVMTVPYESLPGLAQQIPPPEKMIFIFSLPRSGTTLVSQMFSELDHTWSLSEPDIYTNLGRMIANAVPNEDIRLLIEHGTRLLYRPTSTRQTTFVLKPRSQGLFMVEHFHAIYPQASYIYLYRDAFSYAQSFYQFVRKLGFAPTIEHTDVADMWRGMVAQPDTRFLDNLLPIEYDAIGWEEFLAAMFCLQTEHYLKTFADGVPYCAIRYNELNGEREAQVTRLLHHCGLSEELLPIMMRAFEHDSQAGTAVARDVASEPFTAEQISRFQTIMAQQPRFQNPDLRLPDIYEPNPNV